MGVTFERCYLGGLTSNPWALENPTNRQKLTVVFHSQQEGAERHGEVRSVEQAVKHLHKLGMSICRHQGPHALGVGLGF